MQNIDNRLTQENKKIVDIYVKYFIKHLAEINQNTKFSVTTNTNNSKSALIITNINSFTASDDGKSTIVKLVKSQAKNAEDISKIISSTALKNAKIINNQYLNTLDITDNFDFSRNADKFCKAFKSFALRIPNNAKVFTDTNFKTKIDNDNQKVIFSLNYNDMQTNLETKINPDDKLNELIKTTYFQFLNLYIQKIYKNQININLESITKDLYSIFKVKHKLKCEIETTIDKDIFISIKDNLDFIFSYKLTNREMIAINQSGLESKYIIRNFYTAAKDQYKNTYNKALD